VTARTSKYTCILRVDDMSMLTVMYRIGFCMQQVANQQSKYLAAVLNTPSTRGDKPFVYKHLGSMAQVNMLIICTYVIIVGTYVRYLSVLEC
jgi:hypothetical protein